MAKKKKKITRESESQREKPRFNWKRALMLALNIVIVFAVFRIGLYYFESLADAENQAGIIGMQVLYAVYTVALCALIIAYFVTNQGFSTDIPTPEQLTDDMTPDEKDAFIAERRVRVKKAKAILMWILPFVIVLFAEIIDVFLIDYYTSLFS